MSSWAEDVALLREPGVGALFAGRSLNMLATAFAPVALAFGVLHLPGATPTTLSIVLACEAVPLVVFLVVGGAIADRHARHVVLFLSQLLACVAYLTLAALIGWGVSDLVLLGTAAALSGIGSALGWPALTGLIPQVLPADRLQTGNALLSFGASIARIVGVVLGGAVTALVGGAWGLALSALAFGVTAALALTITPRATGEAASDTDDAQATSVLADIRDGWREFTRHEWLWVIVAQWSLLILCFNAAHAVLGPVIADQFLGGPTPWAWILAAEGAGDVVAVVVALRWRPRRPILAAVVLTTVFTPIPFVLLGLGAPLPWVIVCAAAVGLVFTLFGILWNTTMQREVPGEALSRVSAYDAMGSLMLGPVGLLLAGPAAAVFGARPAMLACGIAMFVIATVALLSRDVRELEWREEPVAA